MRIFFAGATGVIGRRLVPRLVADGHEVTAVTRRPERLAAIEAMGAVPLRCDVLDEVAAKDAVARARPEVVVQHLTDLPPALDPRRLAEAYERNNRVRAEGTANLVAAAAAAGARRYVAQTVCFAYAPVGGPVKDEEAPLWLDAPPPFDEAGRASLALERAVFDAPGMDGLVLRCGFWYGPGTSFAPGGHQYEEVRRRRYPVLGDGGGVFSFVHIDDVADATILALTNGRPGAYNICDDEPAPVRVWLPEYARAVGARPPRRVPRWLARRMVGEFAAAMMADLRGATNARARRELGWTPRHPSWRSGFFEALG